MNVVGNSPLIVGREGSSRLRRRRPDGCQWRLRRFGKEQHYPATLSTSDSRGASLANLVLSTKTATARAASAVSRPTVMLRVNPRTMKPAKDATAQTIAYGSCVVT